MCPHRLISRGLAVLNARDDLGAVLRHELLDSLDLCQQTRADTAQGFMRGHFERAPVALVVERHNAGLVLRLFLRLFLGLILGGLVLALLLVLALMAFRANAATIFFRLCRPAFRLCRGKHDLTVRKKNSGDLRLEFGSVDRQGHGHGHHTKRFHNRGKFELPECVTCRRRTAMPAPEADRAALEDEIGFEADNAAT